MDIIVEEEEKEGANSPPNQNINNNYRPSIISNTNNGANIYAGSGGSGSSSRTTTRYSKSLSTESLNWHESQITRRAVLKQKIDEYVNTFTVHGLTRVFVGKRIESAFWLVILFCGLVFSVVVVYGLVAKYLNFGIYTEIRSQVTDENFFPSITFCEKSMYLRHHTSYCGIPFDYSLSLTGDGGNRDVTCNYKAKRLETTVASSFNSSTSLSYWTNGFFNITNCKTNKHTQCANNAYFKSLESFNHSCIRWNYAGNLSGINNHVDIEFEFNRPEWFNNRPEIITATPHDSKVHELDRTQRVEIEPHKIYAINLDKTEIRRLPSPFPSNCSNDKKKFHIFQGHYTRRLCIESHKYIEMYKACGDTIDYVRPLIPAEIISKYKQNRTINETLPCISSYLRGREVRTEKCPFPCNEIELMFFPTFKRARNKTPTYRLTIKYHHVAAYRIMEEKELYSWDQMACEIGGFISLVIGASIISFIEVLVFLCLVIFKRF